MVDKSSTDSTGAKVYVAGAFLGVVFVAVFVVILWLLSTIELQSAALESQDTQTQHTTLGSIKSDVALLDAADAKKAQQAQDIEKDQKIDAFMKSKSKALAAKVAADAAGIQQAIKQNLQDLEVSSDTKTFAPPADPSAFVGSVDDYVAGLPNDDLTPQELAALQKALHPLETQYANDLAAQQKADNLEKGEAAQIDDLNKATAAEALPASFNDATYKSTVEDFAENEWLFGPLAFIPHTMLVLLLALFMGMLGSLIALARDMAQFGVARSTGEMSFRIGLGAAVALAMFCFAAGGVLALSAGQQSNTSMSPYLISFLGITAGYLSDRVTAWMRQIGEQTFKLDNVGQPDRWAVGLDAQMTAQTLTSTAMAPVLGVAAADIDAWRTLSTALPYASQQALTYFLRVKPALLFTDIKP